METGQKLQEKSRRSNYAKACALKGRQQKDKVTVFEGIASFVLSFSHLYWVSVSKTFCYRTGKKYIFEYELTKTSILRK